ncbi:NPH1 [Symbiodinium sp. CCMP2456]|nr:NPH1 [Symbiodinium sp. CCMP2456]
MLQNSSNNLEEPHPRVLIHEGLPRLRQVEKEDVGDIMRKIGCSKEHHLGSGSELCKALNWLYQSETLVHDEFRTADELAMEELQEASTSYAGALTEFRGKAMDREVLADHFNGQQAAKRRGSFVSKDAGDLTGTSPKRFRLTFKQPGLCLLLRLLEFVVPDLDFPSCVRAWHGLPALQACIEDLERCARISFDLIVLPSRRAFLARCYPLKHKLQYTSLREDHQQACAVGRKLGHALGVQVVSGLIQKLATLEAPGHPAFKLKRLIDFAWQQQPETAQARQTSVKKSKKLEEALRKVAQRKQRRPRPRREVPSLLQLSAQNGEDPPRNEGDWSQDQEIELNARSGQNPTSLMQLAATAAAESLVDAVEAQAPAHSPASLLEQEMSSLANLFWKPLTGRVLALASGAWRQKALLRRCATRWFREVPITAATSHRFLIAYCFAWYIATGEGYFPNPFEDSFRWSAGEELREVARKKALGLSFAREVLAPLEITEELLRKDVLQRSQPEEW